MFTYIKNKHNSLFRLNRNFHDSVTYNHYRDVRLLDKYACDVSNNLFVNKKLNVELNDSIAQSMVYSFRDFRNYRLQNKYKNTV